MHPVDVCAEYGFATVYYEEGVLINTRYRSGPGGFEPSTNCSAGSHSIQTELWAP
jgi:hypothetical protein